MKSTPRELKLRNYSKYVDIFYLAVDRYQFSLDLLYVDEGHYYLDLAIGG